MFFRNTKTQFGWISIGFHWIMALLIVVMLTVGIYMTRIPFSLSKLKLYGIHKEIGMLILFLVVLRLSWRLANITPTLENLPSWEEWSAKAMHYLLYCFMFLMPITGWLVTSSAGLPVSFFGLFTIPIIISPNPDVQTVVTDIHQWLAYSLIAMIGLHSAAALKHHFIDKDSILRRMLWP